MDPNTAIWAHCLDTAALSDIGLRRGNNQDALAVVLAGSEERFEQRGHLFMVADGMGAHAAGELASKLATDSVPLTYFKRVEDAPAHALLAAVQGANAQIHNRGMASDDFRGMGTTVSVLVLLPEGALVAHVGDSRVYRLRGQRLEQLTFDHSLVWELRAAGHVSTEEYPDYIPKNIITRSLGPNAEVQVDLEGPYPLQPGDTFLLCSDGLSGQVEDNEISQILQALGAQEAARALVDLANLRGGPDNITVVVARVTGPLGFPEPSAEPGIPAPSPAPPEVHPAVWTALGLLVVAAVALGLMGMKLAAVVSLLAALGAAVIALVQLVGSGGEGPGLGRLGKGPYMAIEGPADAEFVGRLAQVVGQLRDAAAGADWQIEWEPFRSHETRAVAAAERGAYVESVHAYCQAMMSMMAELRRQAQRRCAGNDDSASLLENP